MKVMSAMAPVCASRWKISPQRALLGEGGEVEAQGVALVDGEAVFRHLVAQPADQIPVQFHHRQVRHLLQQRERQGALAGADFHHGLAVAGRHRAHQPVDDLGVVQEVLAEAFAGAMFAHGLS
jgi:hypothetical protein